MSAAARIGNIIYGLILVVLGLLLILDPAGGYRIVAVILGASLALYGIRNIIYYFSMARHMVGGRMILYFGVLVLDAGALFLALSDVPAFYIMIYLIVIRALSGVIDLLRALEQKSMGIPKWILMLVSAVIHFLLAIACAVFIRSANIAVYIYAAGLIYSAIVRIITALRPPKTITIL